jgi:hypothetical protein
VANGCLDPTQLGNTCELVAGALPHLTAPLPDGNTCAQVFTTASGTASTETQICIETLGGIFTSKCAASFQLTPCLCGPTATAACESGAALPAGAEIDTYECDFDTTSISAVLQDLQVQTFGSGTANQIVACLSQNGCDCF